MPKEEILVVPRAALGDFIDFRGFKQETSTPPEFWKDHFQFKLREEMERDPAHKQFIPYVTLRNKGYVFRYWRTKKAGESRLHHLYSIGIGGHINPRDTNLFTSEEEMIHEAAMRELNEEIKVQENVELKHIGYINDDESEVGKVHIGIVYEAWLPNQDIETSEQALGRGEWKPVEQLFDGAEYETWSTFLIEAMLNQKE